MGRVRQTRVAVVVASVLLVATAFTVVASVATGSAGAAASALDNFECYSASSVKTAKLPAPFSAVPRKVSVRNVFSPGGSVAVVGALQMHCDPTRKTVVSAGHSVTSPITNAKGHLACWAIKPTALRLPAGTTVKNQFGTSGLQPTAARSLCLPSWETTTAPPRFPTGSTPPNLDAFACYTVTHRAGTPAFKPPASVHLQDQFGSIKTSVGAPNLLCLPSSITIGSTGTWTKVANAAQYAVCFAIPSGAAVKAPIVYDKNRYGAGAVRVAHNTELCLPSAQVVVPPPTTTTAPTTTTTAPGTLVPVTSYASSSIQSPIDITVGPDGALWFTNAGNDSIGRITTDGTVTNYTDPSIASPDGITLGPDGALWFTNAANNTIGRITTAGSVSHFSGAGINQPFDIVTGSDGALWFTNNGSLTNNAATASIGRITTAGVVTNFKTTAFGAVSYPDGIALGPDGALWFANTGYPGISQITPAGVITRFTNATVSTPYRLTAGPDGAMWFTNGGNGSIGRIATDGTISDYPDPTISDAQGIVTGPDGALWFANYGNNTIGRITTAGAVTDFNNPAISHPDSITVGPDGALWFTNVANNTIGRIVPP
jgi:virginiamycin B lyase